MNTSLPQLTTRKVHRTDIEWTDYAVGSPFVFRDRRDGRVIRNACVKVSAGCANCYAESIGLRFKNAVPYTKAEMGNLDIMLDDSVIQSMLTFKPKPPYRSPDGRPKVFMGDMTDVFGEWVPFDMLDRVFAAMALRPDVDWQILTKRPERMAEFFSRRGIGIDVLRFMATLKPDADSSLIKITDGHWSLPNVWLGTSVENQAMADHRIPHLLRCPAAVRFLSCEPLLAPIDLGLDSWWHEKYDGSLPASSIPGSRRCADLIHHVIVGGESGHNARPCDVDWIRSIVRQRKDAGVPCFVKQLGSLPSSGPFHQHPVRGRIDSPVGKSPMRFADRKGGDPSEWPDDLRVREWPGVNQ